ncbi:MAG: M64 family metallopeptidase [bacterium]
MSLLFLIVPLFSLGQPDFDDYFIKKSFRFDFLLGGKANEVTVYPVEKKQEPYWAGSINGLIDTFNYGICRFRVFDEKSGDLIYSRGFSTLFQEWQTIPEAKIIERSFYQSITFPFPLNPVRFEIDVRQWMGEFKTIFTTEIDPDDYFILKEPLLPYETKVIFESGNPQEKIDLVFLAEGYKKEEMGKFMADAQRLTQYLFEQEPFKSVRNCFNIRTVLSPSVDSGTDVPGEGIYKNTIFNSSFYTFDIDRYLTTDDMKAIHDAAACVPYDHIYILVNTDRYGGGGIYNFLNICSADNALSEEVFVHEFGHGFAGLGDEYYSSSVAYEDFYNTSIEPWEPNLTTLIDFESKWAVMVNDTVPIPTPRLKKFSNTVGVFEGGGYQAKGIYSPFIDCRMKSNDAKSFCPVCIGAIQRMINFYCQ